MPDGQIKPLDRMPILWIAMGRQRVGKTALLNTAVQYFRAGGNPIRVWNADQQNRSHTLSVFFPDAEEVPNAGLEDGKTWIEERIEDLIRHRYDAVLDVGGGATGFSRLVQEVPLLEAIEGSAVRVVGLFCIGPETADLDYLEQFAEVDMFMPAATVIVANGGLVLSGRSIGGAFKPILEHSAIRAAMAKGGRLAMFPALSCMSQVTDRGLTFAEAAKGQAKPGGEPLALFDRARVNRWWTRDVPEFFANIPREWLPVAAADVRESEAG
ncbi:MULTISPECIES: hypothetical protein [Acetobacter]|uniref:CobQ/CobB/MinD/ParA nucleotide binding domain-containing protein n=2 Tax=Acetobacter TaxID=434 RepID=A0A511XQ59_9PROT|nr:MULTISPECIES: hypothetical protein [Acetobacter]MBB3884747.1 hypothetical protein [Acetobacter oeni]MBV1838743.1 zeta toxin family protein [Acetobacter estunensis]NHN86713.1 hypothetical protein [Acetobacter musti]NHO20503.1 hypothetical protein [Acetobacter oeni]GBR07851.1 hypothetical protein AA21952_2461 [Acetobacter oeni LMG 21952]